jgi:hypothetical protein
MVKTHFSSERIYFFIVFANNNKSPTICGIWLLSLKDGPTEKGNITNLFYLVHNLKRYYFYIEPFWLKISIFSY